MNSQLLRAKDVAIRLNVSRSQAFALMRDGSLPTVRIGRCVESGPRTWSNSSCKTSKAKRLTFQKPNSPLVTASLG